MTLSHWFSAIAFLIAGTGCTKKIEPLPAAPVSALTAGAAATSNSPATQTNPPAGTDAVLETTAAETKSSSTSPAASGADASASAAAVKVSKPRDFEAREITAGTGAEAKDGSLVTIHYVGTLEDGQKFDSSRDRQSPLSFTLGKAEQIKGWDQGIKGMKVGGKRVLVIPPELAYGDKGAKDVPPNANLFFEIELLDLK